jgi:hypothetical protein
MNEILALDKIRASSLQRLHRDWDSRRKGRDFPSRADFDPLEMKYIIGNLTLVDVLHEPLRFRYRIHASNATERIGIDMTGKLLDSMPDYVFKQIIREHFTEVVRRRGPVLEQRRNHTTDRRVLNDEALVLPLSSDGRTIDMLMVGYNCD